MKKLFMLLPLAALLLASCSKDEQQSINPQSNDGAIWFNTAIQAPTRGLTTESNFAAFYVTALHGDPLDEFAFSNLSVTKSSDAWSYTGDPKYFPGDNSNVSFYAYAPTSLSSLATIDNDDKKLTDFTQSNTVAAQTDVLAAFATGNKINNTMTGVTLDFKHALAQIEVVAKNSNTDKYKVYVLGAKLCRINKTGTMTFQTAATGYPTWSAQTTPANFMKRSTTSYIELNGTAQSIMFNVDTDNPDHFLMVPQQLTAWTGVNTDADGAYLAVLCRIESYKESATAWVQRYPDDPGKYGFSAIPISTNWLPGHKYTYTIDYFGLGGGAGLVDPVPTNPDDPDDSDVDPNPQPLDEDGTPLPGSTGGTAIFPEAKAPITFSVTITDWISGVGDSQTLSM